MSCLFDLLYLLQSQFWYLLWLWSVHYLNLSEGLMRLSSWRWKAIIPVSCKEAAPEWTARRRCQYCNSLHLTAAEWVPVGRGAGHIACCGQGCWELQAALGSVNGHSLPASALQRGLKMPWARIIAMGTFSECCFTGGGVGRKTHSVSLPLPWYLSCAAGILGGL